MTYDLDFNLLPVIDKMSAWMLLDIKIENEMRAIGLFVETLDRARAAAHFLAALRPATEAGVNEDDDHWRSEAYLRAGLTDFSSIDDTLPRDLRSVRDKRPPRKIRDSGNPLVHLLKLLRNANVHAGTSKVKREMSDVSLKADNENVKDLTITIGVIKDLDVHHLLDGRKNNRYRPNDLTGVVDWFNQKQLIFGAGHLLRRGVELYCQELIHAYR